MQPPDREPIVPDPSLPTFEAAPAPTNSALPPLYRADAPPMPAPGWPEQAPIPPPFGGTLPRLVDEFPRRVARWRWLVSLLLIGLYPLWVSLLGRVRPQHGGKSGAALPSSVGGMLLFSALELGVFGVFWALAWAFSRASKDELLLRWKGKWLPVWQGFGYAFALRLALLVIIVFAAGLFLTLTHTDPKQFSRFMEQNQPKTDGLFPPGALHNPLYLFLLVTLLSFVVAGLREELWRTACLAALRHLLPEAWSSNARWGAAIVISSVVFGLGHIYQGPLGVVFTSILGAGLGLVTWRHRSIWPSVFAHGFIDATSFLAAAAMAGHKMPVAAWCGPS